MSADVIRVGVAARGAQCGDNGRVIGLGGAEVRFEEGSLNARIITLCALLVLTTGGMAWWERGDPGLSKLEPPPPASSEDVEPPRPSPTDSSSAAAPSRSQSRPVAACEPGQPPGRIPGAYWGMHVASPIGHDFPDAPITAVNLTTSQVYWNQVETAPGRYDFSRLDAIVSTAEDRRARAMLVLGFTPAFHAKQPESLTARTTMPGKAAWRAWVTAVVERYGDRLDYQIWPEPNIPGNWTGTPAQMARLTVIAGDIIHDRAPAALVVAPAVALRLEAQRRWVDRFWSTEVAGAPVAESVDAVALDPFPLEDGTPEDSLDLVCQAREILAVHGVDLPVWTNEINYGVASGGPTTDVQHYRDGRQAAAVARTYLLHAAMGMERVYWLGWFSYPGMAVEMTRDGVTTPAGEAYRTVHGWLAQGPRPDCRVEAGLHTCLVEGHEETLLIHWRVRGTSRVPAPDGATRVETIAGERRLVGAGDVVWVRQAPVAMVTPSRDGLPLASG
jgi:hypothetical protein